ncbi:hypothetical protein OQA88_11527 [Cercophora sp. LCS_1]
MVDPVRLTAEDFRTIYEQGFQTWSALYTTAVEQTVLPSSYISLHGAIRQHPLFPPDLRLKHVKHAKHSQVYATGSAEWASTQPDCEHGLPQFQFQDQIPVASKNPIPLSITVTAENVTSWGAWFSQGDQNCLAILILAWSYILSARWAELMPEGTSFVYTSSMADAHDTHQPDDLRLEVDIGYAGLDEARWWAAVLAPGQGWQANMSLGEDTFLAPWSVKLQPGRRFLLSTTSAFQNHSSMAPSSLEALRFLDSFCLRRNAVDQGQAALAAVVLLPSICVGKCLQLPALGVSTFLPQQQCIDTDHGLPQTWADHVDDLDRLITLSCRSKGIRPMLLSTFYNPRIECNAVTPWLQGSLAALNGVGQDEPLILGRMLMDRQPKVASLWLGVTVLGLQQTILREVGFGMMPIDLQSAAWSGAIQSFIQEPVSDPLVIDDHVSKADECRILFLSRSGSHDRVPVCQWRPFGRTPIHDTDLEVRAHAKCKHHGLLYRGFTWDCTDGKTRYQPANGHELTPPLEHRGLCPPLTTVDYGNLDLEKDFVSENTTRNIFGWLRIDGYDLGERDIWKHAWFGVCDSDEEVEEGEDTSEKTVKSSSNVETWLPEAQNSSTQSPELLPLDTED